MKVYIRPAGYCREGGVFEALRAGHFACLAFSKSDDGHDDAVLAEVRFTITITKTVTTKEVIE